jgi:hypothetical protein
VLRFRDVYPDPNLSSPDPGSKVKNIPDLDPHQGIQVFLIQKIVSKLPEMWSGMVIPDPDLDFLPTPDTGSRGQKAPEPGSRIRIRNKGTHTKICKARQLVSWTLENHLNIQNVEEKNNY